MAYHNRGTPRFLRALPPRLVDGCSPPWRLLLQENEHGVGESGRVCAPLQQAESVCQLRTAAEQDLLTTKSTRLASAQTNA
mmetsp:Transcript_29434/g.80768  ORF Transcript_29434/g.80768 Transcript_29434/m.80768 type:complete len:81 (+) Transcript_29434:411-653(+)